VGEVEGNTDEQGEREGDSFPQERLLVRLGGRGRRERKRWRELSEQRQV
jgi:hypothetical protein